jgi:hypothetical protein
VIDALAATPGRSACGEQTLRALPAFRDKVQRVRRLGSFVTWLGILVISGAIVTSVARADRVVPPSRIESPRGVALGTGVRAAAASSQAQADNPANLVLGGVYHIESFLAYDPTFKRLGWGGAVVDSMTSRVAAGISARALFGENDAGKNSGYEVKLGLGVPLGDLLSIGISGRYANFNIADPRATPERLPEENQEPDRRFRLKRITMDAAITLRPVPGFALAALAYNVIDTKSPLAPLMVGGGAAFSSSGLTLGGDVLVDLNKHELFSGPKLLIGGGLEYLASGIAPLRIGYAYDQGRRQSFITGGLGFVDPRFGAQLSLRQSVNGKGETSLFFGVQYFVQ